VHQQTREILGGAELRIMYFPNWELKRLLGTGGTASFVMLQEGFDEEVSRKWRLA